MVSKISSSSRFSSSSAVADLLSLWFIQKDDTGGTLVGFAGATADAFTLLERLEGKLDEYPGQLSRSCVELAKGWRTDKYLRRLEAALIVADDTVSLEISGNGDVLESYDGILGVGSGSPYAIGTCTLTEFAEKRRISSNAFIATDFSPVLIITLCVLYMAVPAAARALMDIPELSAEDVALKAMNVAADMCVYTNHNFKTEILESVAEEKKEDDDEKEKKIDHEKKKEKKTDGETDDKK